jgi:hypothetical protein
MFTVVACLAGFDEDYAEKALPPNPSDYHFCQQEQNQNGEWERLRG